MRRIGRVLAAAALLSGLVASGLFAGCVSRGSGSDFDRDGLKDEVEDSNGNFTQDPGETDFTKPDTDGDGLCDGRPRRPLSSCSGCEDCDGDGFWEPCAGETDPLNPDTDGDGLGDAEDPDPLDRLGIDCSGGGPRLRYGDSLPPSS